MIRTDIGEMVISIKQKGALKDKVVNYVFRPSFENLSKLGEPSDIISAYSVLFSNEAFEILNRFKEPNKHVFDIVKEKLQHQLNTAKKILTACCEVDALPLISNGRKKPLLDNQSILVIARTLLEYGVTGKAKVRVSQRNQSKRYTNEFRINDYINNARIHLGLPLSEAQKLTMTEYIQLMANKYPDNDGFTKEEYDSVMADYEKRRAQRLAQSKNNG